MVLALARADQLHHVVDGIVIIKSEAERSRAEKWRLESRLGQELPQVPEQPDFPEDTPPRTFL